MRRLREREFSQRELETMVAFWQAKLRLQDWDVDIGHVRPQELSEDSLAFIAWNDSKKVAKISIVPEKMVPRDRVCGPDTELAIVHELLHLHLVDWPSGGTGEEVAVHKISEALVSSCRWMDRPELQIQTEDESP